MDSGPFTYAIGDVHGCAALLDALLERIADHAGDRAHRLVFLGDYIDRGPDSAGVLHTISRLAWAEPDRVTCLMGNHERMLLDALHTPQAAERWLYNGGDATLASFGAHEAADLPRDTLDWIEALPTLHGDAAHWYVHAGFRPGADIRIRTITTGSGSASRSWRATTISAGTWSTATRPSATAARSSAGSAPTSIRGGLWRDAHGRVFSEMRGPAVALLQVRAR